MEPELAVAASPREWSQRLYRHVVDHGGARLRATVLSPQDALQERYDIFVVDDTTSYLSQRLVHDLRRHGRRILGVFDPDDPWGKDELLALGVDDVIERSASPEEFLRAITVLAALRPAVEHRHGPAQPHPDALITHARGRMTAVAGVSGGCGATEVAIALAARVADRGERCVLIDADDVAPSLAQRLGVPLYPNVRAAVDIVERADSDLDAALAAVPRAGFEVLPGMSSRNGWIETRPSELLSVAAALARCRPNVILGLGTRVEDVPAVGGQGRYGHTRTLLAGADAVVGVGLPDPVGVARMLDWVAEVQSLAPSGALHLVFNRAGSSFSREQVGREMLRSVSPASLSFLPFDARVPAAGWAGKLVSRGPFTRAVARVVDTVLPTTTRRGTSSRRRR